MLSEAVNKPLPADYMERSFGMKNITIIPRVLQWTQDPKEVAEFSRQKEAFYRQLVKEGG
jgi:hypothetical protein